LTDTSTQGLNVTALQLVGEWDWSQAQIVLLDAETDEATAVVTIPPAATGGQALWPGDGGSIDTVRAVNTAVKVQRQITPVSSRARWTVLPVEAELPVILPKPNPPAPKLPAPKPQPPTPPPPPQPVVKAGSELEDAFTYCAYAQYGSLTALQRALCQGSWRQWYQKQWVNGSVNHQAFKAYNLALQAGAGAVAYLRDNKQGTQILAEGFAGLDAVQARTLLSYAAELPQTPVNLANQQAKQLLDQVDPQSLKAWFEALLQAYRAGQFDQQYEQLIASESGFVDYQNKMQQFLQITFDGVMNSTEPIDIKALTKNA
jgi:hypothetical protein